MEIVLAAEAAKGRFVLTELAEDGLGFRFMRSVSRGVRPIHVPRHHHPFSQVRWAEKGPRCYGFNEYIDEGDIGYFPRAAYYGPELLGDTPGLASTTLQFGFYSEYRPMRDEIEWNVTKNPAYKERMAAHAAGGGKWPANQEPEKAYAQTERHPTWRTDSYPGVEIDNWRENRRPVAGTAPSARAIPQENYNSVIVMHPKAQAFYQAAPGVEVKQLGRFYDHPGPHGDTGISTIRLSDAGSYQFGRDRAQLVWSTSDGLTVDGQTYPAVTTVYSPRGEETEIGCEGATEVIVVEFPRLD